MCEVILKEMISAYDREGDLLTDEIRQWFGAWCGARL
jgi:hypothetical protein